MKIMCTIIVASAATAALGLALPSANQTPTEASAAKAPRSEGPAVRWYAPGSFVLGAPFKVQVEIEAPAGGTVISSWLLTPAAFSVDKKTLSKREDRGSIELPAGYKVTGTIDLSPHLQDVKGDFLLEFASGLSVGEPLQVQVYEAAPAGLKMMEIPAEDLGKYQVLIETNRGSMLAKMWPEVAPNHVRNFLDLAHTKFYDGLIFHRVMPGFMIQGGCPLGEGTGSGPRTLKAEFNSRNHLPGVLSMARSPQGPDTASSQFFICHVKTPQLDGQYTAFGELLWGFDVVDKIANTPTVGTKPREPQKIERMLVLRKPAPSEDAPAK